MRFLLHVRRAVLCPARTTGIFLDLQAREPVASLLLRGGRTRGLVGALLSITPTKGVCRPLWTPGDFVRRPPIQFPADSLALRSSGLYVLIYKGAIPDVSRTEMIFSLHR